MPLPPPRAGATVLLEEGLPAAIDATSFRVKGHIYQKMKENLETTVEGGVERLLERIELPDVQAFLRQRFFAGSWYDAMPMGLLASAHARLVGIPLHPHCRERGRIVATHDVPGIYKALLRLFSPETLISRLPRVATFYFSFGKATAEHLAGGRARTALGGLPYSLAPMLAGVVEASSRWRSSSPAPRGWSSARSTSSTTARWSTASRQRSCITKRRGMPDAAGFRPGWGDQGAELRVRDVAGDAACVRSGSWSAKSSAKVKPA